MARDFLPAADFRETTVNTRIQVYLKGFPVGAENFAFHALKKSLAKIVKI
jgi:hypothetical protein